MYQPIPAAKIRHYEITGKLPGNFPNSAGLCLVFHFLVERRKAGPPGHFCPFGPAFRCGAAQATAAGASRMMVNSIGCPVTAFASASIALYCRICSSLRPVPLGAMTAEDT